MPRIAFISILFLTSVSIAQTSGSMSEQHTNALIEETSPYLLQHAHNPVNWYAWNEATLAKAKNENKLLLISIGYAACHWCHVMEEECFEDEAAAAVMNANFVNIKIDREERPDVDQVYMDALQMMTGSGGWPLNIVALPDGRPFWGATYVKKKEWIGILGQLSDMYQEKPEKLIEYAKKLSEGIKAINLIEVNNKADLVNLNDVDQAVSNWSKYFDTFLGGYKQAPKFMMPVNLDFLLHYGTAKKDADILEYVNTSLTKMAWGGIFDHVGGGFSRYSVDTKWHVPHFEKMLYDNGQLVSLYAKAYAATKNALYKETVRRTLEFVVEELMDENGGFYSSLDADSLTDENELEEGAYYVWQEAELKQLLQDDFEVFKDYFNINSYGHWEHGNYVLIRDASVEKISKKHELPPDALKAIVSTSFEKLKVHRAKRNRPRLDDKILTSWNGLMLRGLVDAYRYLEDDAYLELAIKNADFILKNMVQDDGGLFRNHKNGSSSINAFLEDYAAVIDAFIGLYEITFEDRWLSKAEDLMAYCFQNFFDPKSEMFFFGSKRDPIIIRRSIETTDNVIPASNSIMAQNLFRLSKLFPEKNYEEKALQMLKNMQDSFEKSAQNHANWLQLALFIEQPFYEVAIIGDDFEKLGSQIRTEFLPNTIFAGAQTEGTISLLKNRFVAGKTMAYVCLQGSCKLPETQAQKVLEQLRY